MVKSREAFIQDCNDDDELELTDELLSRFDYDMTAAILTTDLWQAIVQDYLNAKIKGEREKFLGQVNFEMKTKIEPKKLLSQDNLETKIKVEPKKSLGDEASSSSSSHITPEFKVPQSGRKRNQSYRTSNTTLFNQHRKKRQHKSENSLAQTDLSGTQFRKNE